MTNHTHGALLALVSPPSDSTPDSDTSDCDLGTRVSMVLHRHILILRVFIVGDHFVSDAGLTCKLDQMFTLLERNSPRLRLLLRETFD